MHIPADSLKGHTTPNVYRCYISATAPAKNITRSYRLMNQNNHQSLTTIWKKWVNLIQGNSRGTLAAGAIASSASQPKGRSGRPSQDQLSRQDAFIQQINEAIDRYACDFLSVPRDRTNCSSVHVNKSRSILVPLGFL